MLNVGVFERVDKWEDRKYVGEYNMKVVPQEGHVIVIDNGGYMVSEVLYYLTGEHSKKFDACVEIRRIY